ncbi:MAG: hypothetical protein KKA79_02755 [Nanoarchaeota archaeon]|nr:hypothetical protein [Nanoarchaeota archaeon]MCG2718642.1 hypothetical protein [Nanoarchaeota archaeon]
MNLKKSRYIHKKGQTEDIFADFIPAIIIIIIAGFIMQNFSSDAEEKISVRLIELDKHLGYKSDVRDFLRYPVSPDLKEEGCVATRFTVADLVTAVDPKEKENDPCLKLLQKVTFEFDKQVDEQLIIFKDFSFDLSTKVDLSFDLFTKVELQYPDYHHTITVVPSKDLYLKRETSAYVPLRNGGHVNVKLMFESESVGEDDN